jgi:hypothetical protein
VPVTALPRAMHRARPITTSDSTPTASTPSAGTRGSGTAGRGMAGHRARPHGDDAASARGHLTAVPPQPAPFVTAVGPADAVEVARDAQNELVALGHGLHDGPVQSLIAASLALQMIERAGDAAGSDAPRGLAAAREALDAALTSLRGTMGDLNPPGVQGGLGQMLSALSERATGLTVDDRATGAVSAEIAGAVFRLLSAVGATCADRPAVRVVTRDRPGFVVCEVRLRGHDAADRTRREEVERALRRLVALGARSAVARATGGADLLLALPSDTDSAPSPALLDRGQLLHAAAHRPAHMDCRGDRRTGGATALARTGTEDWR